MDKTFFAGLTVLEPGESLLLDGGSFTQRDREIIDRLLQLGAKTHRHTGLSGLDNPTEAMGASAVASAGQIPADTAFSVGYTLEDDTGGETTLSPTITVSTDGVIETPTLAPDLVIDYNAGSLLTDTYYYAYSYVDGEGGETPVGPADGVEREPGSPTAQVQLSNLLGDGAMVSAGATGWRLYRAVGGGDLHYLASGTGDTYTDDGSQDVDCDITPLTAGNNTTNSNNSVIFELPAAGVVGDAEFINVYAAEDGVFAGDVLVDQFPVASAGAQVAYGSIDFLEAAPPAVSTSRGTPGKIDVETEVLNLHWEQPVASAGALPASAEEGDVRLALDDGGVWVYQDSEWRHIAGTVKLASGAGYLPASAIELVGSAGVDIEMSDLGDGVIEVKVDGSDLLGSAADFGINEVLDDDAGSVLDPSKIKFLGSGAVTAAVASGASGAAEVTLTVPPAPEAEGPTVYDDTTAVEGASSIEFSGASGVAVEVSDLGGASASVEISRDGSYMTRRWGSAAVSLGSGATGNVDFDLDDFIAARLLSISADHRSRVIVYTDDEARSADNRDIGVEPTGDHGVLLDYALTEQASGTDARLSPAVDAYNLEDPLERTLPMKVTNYDENGTVTVAFLFAPTEEES